MKRLALVAAVWAVGLAYAAAGRAQSGSIVQDEHDKQVRADTERNTKYHNNADDYPVNKPASSSSTSSGSNYVPVLNPPYKRLYEPNVETEADHMFIGARQHYAAGEHDRDYTLGRCYYHGLGTPVDKVHAHSIWAFAPKSDMDSHIAASEMEYAGDGVQRDPLRAMHRMQEFARDGVPEANAWLVAHHYKAELKASTYDTANGELNAAQDQLFARNAPDGVAAGLKVVQAKADEGYPRSMYLLGRAYEQGLGVAKDEHAAAVQYIEAADRHFAPAEARAGIAFWRGQLGLTVDDDRGRVYLLYGAEHGNAEAQYMLAEATLSGAHGQLYDLPKAVTNLQSAAAQGLSSAQALLAALYLQGKGVPQDFGQAAKWAEKSQDRANSQVVLAYLYRAGEQVPKDAAKSLELMKRAAAGGSTQAKGELAGGFDGTLKGTGNGLPLASEKRDALAASFNLPPIWVRAKEVFRAEAAKLPPISAAEIAATDKMWADYKAISAGRDDKKRYKAYAAMNWDLVGRAGVAHAVGEGIPIDYEKAHWMLLQAGITGVTKYYPWETWSEFAGFLQTPDPAHQGYWNVAADSAVREAPSALAYYAEGLGVVMYPGSYFTPQEEKVRRSMQSAADLGLADAKIELAYMNWQGRGGTRNLPEGLRLMEDAAKTDPNAMYALGTVYANGLYGAGIDKQKAAALLQAAAAKEQPDAKKLVAQAN